MATPKLKPNATPSEFNNAIERMKTESKKPMQYTIESIFKGEIVKSTRALSVLTLDNYFNNATDSMALNSGLTDLLLAGKPLQFDSVKGFLNTLNETRDKTKYPNRFLRSDVSATCQAIDLSLAIRKAKSGELLTAWNASVEAKQKINDANVKANVMLKKNGASLKPITRTMQPSLKGLKDLVITPKKSTAEELKNKYIKSAYALMVETKDKNLNKIVALMASMGIEISKAE
jgi:hypothetical protein